MLNPIYATIGINWEFLYQVEYEDDCILVLKDLGRFHRWDDDRKYIGKIDKYIDIFTDYARVDGTLKLFEVNR